MSGRSKSRCLCNLCKRGRKYYRITGSLPVKQREWMRGFYDSTLDAECELEMLSDYVKRAEAKFAVGMNKNRLVTYPLEDGNTAEMADRCAIINLYGSRPFVQIFDRNGKRTDAEQFTSMAEAAKALVRVHKGGRLNSVRPSRKQNS